MNRPRLIARRWATGPNLRSKAPRQRWPHGRPGSVRSSRPELRQRQLSRGFSACQRLSSIRGGRRSSPTL
eukprot:6300757-Pyramimonas_sp.AAC.1